MNTILRLFYDLSVYKDIINQKFIHTLLRYLLAYLLLSASYSFYISQQYAPDIINTTQTVLATIVNSTPREATLTISDYRLSTTNLTLPFTVNNYIYLDSTTENFPLDSSAIVTISSTAVRFLTQTNTYETITFRELELNNLWITGQEIQNRLTDLSQKLTQLAPYLPIFFTLPIFLGLSIARMFQAIFYAFLFLLGISLTKGHYRFKEITKITFHSIIVAEAINLAILVVYGNTYPTIFSAAFIGVSILAYFNLPARLKL
jgi:hypothetical protein